MSAVAVQPHEIATSHLVAWQGFALDVPAEWNPTSIDGDFSRGSLLLSDLVAPRLALRWRSPGRLRPELESWAASAMKDEVGTITAADARPFDIEGFVGGLLFIDPDPPGRDVWLGRCERSGRLLEVVRHTTKGDSLSSSLFSTIRAGGDECRVFDFGCTPPHGWRLSSHRFAAGDLRLTFSCGREWMIVREIRVASLALGRMPLDRWLAAEEYETRRRYRPNGDQAEATVARGAERTLALRSTATRRLRYRLWRGMPPTIVSLALVDETTNTLLMAQGSDELSVRALLAGARRWDV